ncbi:MAG: NifU family protein [Bacteroidota bacterium]
MENHSLFTKINAALEGIRPYLLADGGNVKILEITPDNIVKIEFEGACVSCNMSVMTFRGGIEDAILKAVPEVKKVIAVNMPVLQ